MMTFALDARVPSFSLRREAWLLEFHSFEKILVVLQSSASAPQTKSYRRLFFVIQCASAFFLVL